MNHAVLSQNGYGDNQVLRNIVVLFFSIFLSIIICNFINLLNFFIIIKYNNQKYNNLKYNNQKYNNLKYNNQKYNNLKYNNLKYNNL
jgi:hypothetical protein